MRKPPVGWRTCQAQSSEVKLELITHRHDEGAIRLSVSRDKVVATAGGDQDDHAHSGADSHSTAPQRMIFDSHLTARQ